MEVFGNLHDHIPIVQLVVEKQEYFQFDLLSSAQMWYPDHKPIIEKSSEKKFKAQARRTFYFKIYVWIFYN